MGCDGGTIPKRDELVRTKQRGEQKDREAELIAKWRHCALTANKLLEPIVACDLGRLYNKVSIIEYLLNKDSAPNAEVAKHIRNLKDVHTLNLTEKQDFKEKGSDIGGEYVDTQDSRFVCPVVGLEMNGKYKFCFIRNCGCVFSERALKEVKSETCYKCNKEFSPDDIITLNGTDEEVENLRIRMEERRANAKNEKKSKKRKAESTASDAPNTKLKPTASTSTSSSLASSLSSSSIPSSSTKTSTIGILTDKARKDYSVAKDPTASETYKSLFTTHETAKSKPKAHWVTFNPCYY